MSTDTLFEQSERVRDKLQPWLQTYSVASNFIKKGEVEQVGERDYRIPFLTQNGLRYGTMNKDGGDYGRGTAMKGGLLISTFFTTRGNFELTQLKMDATANTAVAVKSAFKQAMMTGMPEYALQEDFSFHSDGTAVKATAVAVATVSGQTVYTMEANNGVQRVRRGDFPVIYDTTFGTVRSTTLYVAAIDYINKKVFMSGTVPGAAATDVLCYDGVTGTGAAPQWKKGMWYFLSSQTSGFLLQLNRATEPEAVTNFVNVNGPVNHLLGNLLLDYIDTRRPQSDSGLIGLCNRSQRAQIMNNEIQISRWDRGKKDELIDVLPVRLPSFEFCGKTVYIDPQQDRSRIDFINPKLWGRARLTDLHWVTTPGGQRFFPLYGGSGAPAASIWFGLTMDEDFYSVDMGGQGSLLGCTLPTGY